MSGSPNIRWVPPEEPKYLLPPMPELEDRHENTSRLVVTVLTVACTLLALFDVFLLVWGL